jgi:hypothetical protein
MMFINKTPVLLIQVDNRLDTWSEKVRKGIAG